MVQGRFRIEPDQEEGRKGYIVPGEIAWCRPGTHSLTCCFGMSHPGISIPHYSYKNNQGSCQKA
jgi:hypothetical protein